MNKARVAVFVDSNNLIKSATSLHGPTARIDWDELLRIVLGGRELVAFRYYREGTNRIAPLEKFVQDKYQGSVINTGASSDIPLTLDAVGHSTQVDVIVMMSGDSDFIPLYRFLKGRVQVEVVSMDHATKPQVKLEIDRWHELMEDMLYHESPNPRKG